MRQRGTRIICAIALAGLAIGVTAVAHAGTIPWLNSHLMAPRGVAGLRGTAAHSMSDYSEEMRTQRWDNTVALRGVAFKDANASAC